MDKRAIGVFDSGLGGLTVLKEIKNKLPNECTIYFGDTARVPYGSKTTEQIREYTIRAMEFFVSKNVKAIVIACNTATVSALKEVRRLYDIPIIGVVEPGARAVSRVSNSKEILILGTEGTIRSGAYEQEVLKHDKEINVISKACPTFVSLVEDGMSGTSVAYYVVSNTLNKFKGTNIDSVVLGCTHYPYLKQEIAEVMGEKVTLVDPAIETVEDLKKILNENNILNLKNSEVKSEFYVSGDAQKFKEKAQEFMAIKIDEVNKIKGCDDDVEKNKKLEKKIEI